MDTTTWRNDAHIYLNPSVWVFYRYCTCGGTPRFKYKNAAAQLELWVMPLRNKFSVFKNGPAIINGAPITEMREWLGKFENSEI